MVVEISRGSVRFTEREQGRLTRHAFSFGPHYDPDRLAFGPLRCHDDHLLGRDAGFDDHPHSALEIVTWVVSGRVRHRDSLGNEAVLSAGEYGVLSAGSGVRHAEHAVDGPARFVQCWIDADPDAAPGYRCGTATPGHAPYRLFEGTAGDQTPTAYDVVRLAAGEAATLPAAPRVHAFVATGALLRSSLAEPLEAGDAFLLTDEPAHEVRAAVPTDLLVWSFG